MYRRAQVVAVSKGTRADLVDLGFDPGRITVVTNGVVPPGPVEHLPSSHPTIMCMGRLKPQKSVDVLLRSLPMVIDRFPGLHLDIVGQGPDRTRLERLAWSTGLAGHVRFHGYVAALVRDEVAASAWVSACPSSFEGWGVVCMEASAHGLPVVASNVAGLRESVQDGETGILFPYGDERALAKALISLLSDSDLRARMGWPPVGSSPHLGWQRGRVRGPADLPGPSATGYGCVEHGSSVRFVAVSDVWGCTPEPHAELVPVVVTTHNSADA
jgi:glycosyltransferase involved in cell wall biosynthesis